MFLKKGKNSKFHNPKKNYIISANFLKPLIMWVTSSSLSSTRGLFGTWWNSSKLEHNNYSDELICQMNFRLSRRVRNSTNPVYQVIGGIPD
jgi:hypothetical protein